MPNPNADAISAELKGAKALFSALKTFPTTFVNKAMKPILKEAVHDIVVPDAVRRTPEGKTGKLRRSIRVRAAKGWKGQRLRPGVIGFAAVSAKLKTLDAYYAKFVFHDRKVGGYHRLSKRAYTRITASGEVRTERRRIKKETGGRTIKGTRSLRKALYNNEGPLLRRITSRGFAELPKIAHRVRLANQAKK